MNRSMVPLEICWNCKKNLIGDQRFVQKFSGTEVLCCSETCKKEVEWKDAMKELENDDE